MVQLPVRVLVKGSSIVNWSSPMSGPRSNFTFARVVEAELLRAGHAAHVLAPSIASERTKTGLKHWESEALTWSPDVVVLAYGYYESIHLFLPWWLERHVNALRGRHGRLRDWYRKGLLNPTWMVLARRQAWIDQRVPSTALRRDKRVVGDLERLIANIRQVSSPLVLLFELLPPTHSRTSWFPGMPERIARMNASIADLVTCLDDPEVRLFKVTDIVDDIAGGDLDQAVPDGFHFSVPMHREIGIRLAREITTWAATTGHLEV